MTASDLISLPSGGGAVRAVGETFTPDLHTGTGRMSVPIELPSGRNGLAPSLMLAYSSGHGNGPFGLGWQLGVPGVFRKTAKRIPRYDDSDVFLLSDSEDLVPVAGATDTGAQRYRPRVESAFARIEHHGAGSDHWEIHTVDGLVSRYGTPRPTGAGTDWRDPAVVADPADPNRVLGWLLTSTRDSLGNVIAYEYTGDPASPQRYLFRIGYGDYLDDTGAQRYLLQVRFVYEPRPDRIVQRRGGFPVATTLRCAAIETWTDPGTPQRVRAIELGYTQGGNGVSLLSRVRVVGYDGSDTQALPPLELGYTSWDPARRRYQPMRAGGGALPDVSLGHPDVDLVDLFGDGLPDVVQLSTTDARYWRNRGAGRLDPPRPLRPVPAGAALGQPGVMIADLDGDGRPDLLVSDGTRAGYFPIGTDGGFVPKGYVRYDRLPPFGLRDPDSRLIDLDGDGVVDLLRIGQTTQLAFNRRAAGWVAQPVGNADLTGISLRDNRMRLADMTGDGLSDLVLVTNGQVQYWPNLGFGRFGAPVVMASAPRIDDSGYRPDGFDPRRLLLGDVDGDGCADLVYVGTRATTVWVNQCGESFAAGTTIPGTPLPDERTTVRLVDMLGTGTAGILWTYDARLRGDATYKFLDLTGDTKPYILSTVDNHTGARTVVTYAPSTRYAAEDAAEGRPWRTTLPFPVHVVSQTTTTDALSRRTQTVEYRYHHGYWDGAEREFRGFGCVDQFDAQRVEPGGGLPPDQYSPPTRTRTWLHQGPVGPEYGDWTELDLSGEYWSGDANLLGGGDRTGIPAGLSRRRLRDTLRALAGCILRTELSGPDIDRPYTVTEHCYNLVAVNPDATVVAAHRSGTRTTQWERGTEPRTQATLTGGFDVYGRPRTTLDLALPRGWDPARPAPVADPPLATVIVTDYATRDDPTGYRCDRVATSTHREVRADGSLTLAQLRQAVLVDSSLPTRLLSATRTAYDGDAFVGLPPGQIGDHGLPTATATLALTRGTLAAAIGPVAPPYLDAPLPAGLRGEYFTDDALVSLAFTRPDPAVDFAWLGGPDPALSQPTFSARWTGTLTPRFTETYSLRLDCAGGARIWLGPQLLLDAWTATPAPVSIALTAGTAYPLRVEYRATGWAARVQLFWSSPSQPAAVVAATAYGPPTGTGAAPWPAEYPADFQTEARAGYAYRIDPEPGYYITTGARYDVHDGPGGRGLPTVQRDVLGHDTTITYDAYRILAAGVTDPAGLVRTARYDLRVLKPAEVVDANGNHSVAGYTPLGLLSYTATLGHPGLDEADTIEQPGTRYEYGLTAWDDTPGQPSWVHTVRRAEHRWTLVDAENARRAIAGQPPLTDVEITAMFPADELTRYPQRFLQSRVYRDGAGRDLQTRTQADSTIVDDLGLPADTETPAGPLATHEDPEAVTISGSNSYDNKGRVVRAWEPSFGSGWAYTRPDRIGPVCTTTSYDPRGEVVLVVHPDGSQDRTVHGIPADLTDPDRYAPTPWETYNYDGNDNAGRTHPEASQGWSSHWNTPASTVLDALGRTVTSISRLPLPQARTTRNRYDVQGRLVQVTDPLGRTVAMTGYDLHGRAWSTTLLDAGSTTTALDAASNVLERRDAKGALTLYGYDALSRVTRVWCRDSAAATLTLRQVTRYGDAPDAGLAPADAAPANLLGRAYQRYDEAGLLTVARYDPAGLILAQTRQVFSTATLLAPGYTTDWQNGPGVLDPTGYHTDSAYDALGRRTTLTTPTDTTGVRRTVHATFAPSGGLSTVDVDGAGYVRRILYNARGQRMLAEYGNGIRTRYAYDPATARLVRQYSAAETGPARQDYGYHYDLVGNPVTIFERTPGSGLPGPTPDALDRLFSYDALYRLTTATGREHQTPLPDLWSAAPRGTDVTATQAYTESYDYDLAGNLLHLSHKAAPAGWTRTVTLVPGTNQLSQITAAGTAHSYTYDLCGNLIQETTSRHFEWDATNRLLSFRVQPAGSNTPSQSALYRYDGTGTRVTKLARTQNGALELTLYLDGGLEALMLTDPGGTTSRHDELHLTDGTIRVAVLRIGDPLPGDQRPPVGYHLNDRLGSNVQTLDGAGQQVNREEYAPYGETTFGGYARKRYRFTGRERDEESGLAYHGARYYAPWLTRWTSCDPAGHVDGTNLYHYASSNPMRLTDPSGRAAEPPKAEAPTQRPLNLVTGKYSTTKGHHIMQSAAYEQAGKDPMHGKATAISQTAGQLTPSRHNAASRTQTTTNRAAHGAFEGERTVTPGRVGAPVTVESSGNGRNVTASPYFEETKAYYGLRSAGASPDQAFELVDLASTERTESGSLPTRVPNGPKASPSEAGYCDVNGAFSVAGATLTLWAAYQTGQHLSAAYQESVTGGSARPIAQAAVHETGSWVGGFVGGYLAGAALGVETGPGAFITGLVGGAIGGYAGRHAADSTFQRADEFVTSLGQAFDTFVKPSYDPSAPSPWRW